MILKQPLIIAFFLLMTAVLGLLLIWPKYQEFSFLNSEIEEKTLEFANREKYFSDLNNLSQKLENYQPQIQKINSALPTDPSMPALFDFLQKVASQNGLILKGISPTGTILLEEKGLFGVRGIHFTLSLSGSYPSFKNFLSTLEKSARLFEVESITFSSPEETPLFTFDLKLKTHSY